MFKSLSSLFIYDKSQRELMLFTKFYIGAMILLPTDFKEDD
jgi:hypothetical protein